MEYRTIGYKKMTIIAIVISVIATIVSNFVFASDNVVTNDKIIDGTLNVLIFIQKYSWPIMTIVFIYALYQFFVIGSELVEHKLLGRRLIIGIAIFMVIIQCLPLIYAFIIIK